MAALLVTLAWVGWPWAPRALGQHGHGPQQPGEGPHVHVAVPAEYERAAPAPGLWTEPTAIALGKAIHDAKCAVCHGGQGGGDGPAAPGLPVKAASLKDRAMVAGMTAAYWFWRVSEGATVEPFKSMRSTMPAWKGDLSVEERWAVIAYQHTFSGHRGPHTPDEHPEMRGPGAGSHGH